MVDSAQFDIIVVGAGPAGLGAARTAARLGFRTLVLEALPGPGRLAHPCSAVVAPVPGFVSGVRLDDGGLYFPALDLALPSDLVVGVPTLQRFISPAGYEYQATFGTRDDFPVAVIDKPALLRRMARQAADVGAELRFGARVTGLVIERGAVAGVRTAGGEVIRAEAVLAAEGAGRRLCAEAGLFEPSESNDLSAVVLSAELEAPAVSAEDVSQVVTLGQRYTSARHAFGSLLLSAPGRASVHFTVFAETIPDDPDALLPYLDEYLRADPRVRTWLARSRILDRSSTMIAIRDRPARVARDGFMGIGDAVTPGGHLGVIPAVYLGRQAALVAAEAVDSGDTSLASLAAYEHFTQGTVLRSLEAEGQVMQRLSTMSDEDIDRLCQALGRLRMAQPYFGNWRAVAWETVGWLVRQMPLLSADLDLVNAALDAPETPDPPPVPANGTLEPTNYAHRPTG